MRILVTGASGLIGKSLIKNLSAHEVIDIRKIRTKHNSLLLDFSKEWSINDLPSSIDTIIHLAQSRNFRKFPLAAEEIYSVNTLSTAKLLNYAQSTGVKNFIYASTGGIYKPKNSLLKEDSHLLPIGELSFYFTSKLNSEMLCNAYSEILNTTIIRPFFVYGPNQSSDMLIPRIFNSVKNSTPVLLAGNEGISINPIFVEDAAKFIVGIVEREIRGVFNLAGNEILSLKKITERVSSLLDKEAIFKSSIESPNLVANIDNLLNYFPNFAWTPFDEGMERTWKALK